MTLTLDTPQTSVNSQTPAETQTLDAADGPNFPADHAVRETQMASVSGEPNFTDGGQHKTETQGLSASVRGPILRDPILCLYADVLDDLEDARKANENRFRQLTRSVADEDGEMRGFGLSPNAPGVIRLAETLSILETANKQATRNLEKAMKDHPLGAWVKAQNGLGEKTIARLLAAIGDPYWNDLHDRPRTVSELWAYCGLAVLSDGRRQKRTKGQKSNWSDTAKMRLWNVVQPIIKNRNSPYRKLYDEVKESYQGRTYDDRYVGTKLKGKLIEAGDPISPGHINAMTERRVMKQILKDLWIESKRLHETHGVVSCEG